MVMFNKSILKIGICINYFNSAYLKIIINWFSKVYNKIMQKKKKKKKKKNYKFN